MVQARSNSLELLRRRPRIVFLQLDVSCQGSGSKRHIYYLIQLSDRLVVILNIFDTNARKPPTHFLSDKSFERNSTTTPKASFPRTPLPAPNPKTRKKEACCHSSPTNSVPRPHTSLVPPSVQTKTWIRAEAQALLPPRTEGHVPS
ncbi:hypothetical protein BJX63DRAFT_267158 [Aspergillus granulosus]|uniref:Uncharacterized protein n=1 Tax=Aspergillus granulosus TaxID=176169 RepID=A0ABR4H8G1_9EURO